MNGLADKEFCISISWSGDYAAIRARARSAGVEVPLAFTDSKEGANSSHDARLIPRDARIRGRVPFPEFHLEPQVIAQITMTSTMQTPNLAANAYVDHTS